MMYSILVLQHNPAPCQIEIPGCHFGFHRERPWVRGITAFGGNPLAIPWVWPIYRYKVLELSGA